MVWALGTTGRLEGVRPWAWIVTAAHLKFDGVSVSLSIKTTSRQLGHPRERHSPAANHRCYRGCEKLCETLRGRSRRRCAARGAGTATLQRAAVPRSCVMMSTTSGDKWNIGVGPETGFFLPFGMSSVRQVGHRYISLGQQRQRCFEAVGGNKDTGPGVPKPYSDPDRSTQAQADVGTPGSPARRSHCCDCSSQPESSACLG
ncbi:uncharacterized protein LOC143164282 isoform X2 [Aptenodytes patagonicus]|uniref:uncharacterized protein LOC143164282 isoform X2 n=1 Tax=Aptenodytes patagonicus TaxID=9234 RepID=UPI003FA00BE1